MQKHNIILLLLLALVLIIGIGIYIYTKDLYTSGGILIFCLFVWCLANIIVRGVNE